MVIRYDQWFSLSKSPFSIIISIVSSGSSSNNISTECIHILYEYTQQRHIITIQMWTIVVSIIMVPPMFFYINNKIDFVRNRIEQQICEEGLVVAGLFSTPHSQR